LKEWEEFLVNQTMGGMNYAMVAVRMPREIEFRAWDKTRKLMFHNVENTYDTLECVIEREGLEDEVIWSRSFGELLKSGAYEIMQYTGLKDSKGVKVFDGDILEVHLLKNETLTKVGAVEWAIYNDNSHANNKHIGYVVTYFTKVFSTLIDVAKFSKVIGNIYQNPELLEVKE
jgi:uncharacterized phage protein (TIGR01671 family)